MIDVPESGRRHRPHHRKTCQDCGATPAGCDSNFWLRGKRCCPMCNGEHDNPTERNPR